MQDAPGDRTEGRAPLLRELVLQNYDEIGRADSKAGLLLATTGALLALLFSRHPDEPVWAVWLWWAATAGLAGALISLLFAVLPRYGAPPRDGAQPLAYFEDVLRAGRSARLVEALRDSAGAPEARLLRALEGTSHIAHVKNVCLRRALAFLVPAAAASFGVLLLR